MNFLGLIAFGLMAAVGIAVMWYARNDALSMHIRSMKSTEETDPLPVPSACDSDSP